MEQHKPWPLRAALRCAAFAEKWFPDAWVFAVLALVLVAAIALAFGAPPQSVAQGFGKGFWSLIPFTMQMAFVVIGGYVVATAPVVSRLILRLSQAPRTGRGAIVFVATLSMLTSLLSWDFSLMFGGLLARALAQREDCAWITAPLVPRRISGLAPSGQWGCRRRRRSCRRIRRRCRRDCWPSLA